MQVRFFDIDWDMTEDDSEETRTPQDCGLPSECVLEVEDDIDLAEDGTDVLSQHYGWLVNGCSWRSSDSDGLPSARLRRETRRSSLAAVGHPGRHGAVVVRARNGVGATSRPRRCCSARRWTLSRRGTAIALAAAGGHVRRHGLVSDSCRPVVAQGTCRLLKRHREFFVERPAGKEGLLLEILPRTLKKVKP